MLGTLRLTRVLSIRSNCYRLGSTQNTPPFAHGIRTVQASAVLRVGKADWYCTLAVEAFTPILDLYYDALASGYSLVPQTSLSPLVAQPPSFSRLAYVDLDPENEPAPAPATGFWLQGIARV